MRRNLTLAFQPVFAGPSARFTGKWHSDDFFLDRPSGRTVIMTKSPDPPAKPAEPLVLLREFLGLELSGDSASKKAALRGYFDKRRAPIRESEDGPSNPLWGNPLDTEPGYDQYFTIDALVELQQQFHEWMTEFESGMVERGEAEREDARNEPWALEDSFSLFTTRVQLAPRNRWVPAREFSRRPGGKFLVLDLVVEPYPDFESILAAGMVQAAAARSLFRQCDECGNWFEARVGAQRFCQAEHRFAWHNARRKTRMT